jgi:hypothetical protein
MRSTIYDGTTQGQGKKRKKKGLDWIFFLTKRGVEATIISFSGCTRGDNEAWFEEQNEK